MRTVLVAGAFLMIFQGVLAQEVKDNPATLVVSYDIPLWFWGDNINTNSGSIYNSLTGGKGIMSVVLIPLKNRPDISFLIGGAGWFDNYTSGYFEDTTYYYTDLDGGGMFAGMDAKIEHSFGKINLGLYARNSIGYFNFSQVVKLTDPKTFEDKWSRLSYSQIGTILTFGGIVQYGRFSLRPGWNYKLFGSRNSGSIHGWGISVGLGVEL